MEDLNKLSRLTGCYGNQQCLTIIHGLSILLISFLIHGVERQMRYQHDVLKGYYQLGRLMLFVWLPGWHGNHRCPQNVPKFS